VASKSFEVIDIVSLHSSETHKAGPFGLTKRVEGSKITYSDLMLEAARLEADDIIDIRIDMNTSGRTSFFDWLKGWERTFTHTGKALAIRYIDENGVEESLFAEKPAEVEHETAEPDTVWLDENEFWNEDD
jgi:hypothetical protein